ncbi:hypothetical protein CSUI_006190 [Cystoisospora suis]|uniref:Uncharacterized protein n=1 Tax=Cystoisospora suis TaxID=483139 RepID=A0A2C6KUE2_9APIC|nr:hypothetical protein CSUI_006190 [Cystoisospora suis]
MDCCLSASPSLYSRAPRPPVRSFTRVFPGFFRTRPLRLSCHTVCPRLELHRKVREGSRLVCRSFVGGPTPFHCEGADVVAPRVDMYR